MRYQRILDISRPLAQGAAVYPGNPPVRIKKLRSKTSWLSEISFGSHTGTHVDAPRHALGTGAPLESFPLEAFVGPCRVLDCTREARAVGVATLKKFRIRRGERILLKTRNSARGCKKFFSNYVFLDGDAAEYLAALGVKLVGIDSLSIKRRGSADNRSHTELLQRNIPIVEGLHLKNAPPGKYFFIGLPLAFRGIDGVPLRAVLMR